jgi:hypothetical protein
MHVFYIILLVEANESLAPAKAIVLSRNSKAIISHFDSNYLALRFELSRNSKVIIS